MRVEHLNPQSLPKPPGGMYSHLVRIKAGELLFAPALPPTSTMIVVPALGISGTLVEVESIAAFPTPVRKKTAATRRPSVTTKSSKRSSKKTIARKPAAPTRTRRR